MASADATGFTKLYVNDIPPSITTEDLRGCFSKFGELGEVGPPSESAPIPHTQPYGRGVHFLSAFDVWTPFHSLSHPAPAF